MPTPPFTQPWRGVPREHIRRNPSVREDAWIGCGACATGCSRLVHRVDDEREKAVAFDPLNCMVGCTPCANTCPAHAIEFPPIEAILALQPRTDVHPAMQDDPTARREILARPGHLPHPDRLLTRRVVLAARHGTLPAGPRREGRIDVAGGTVVDALAAFPAPAGAGPARLHVDAFGT